jgi:transcriptional regulator with XRE-family HTH domain
MGFRKPIAQNPSDAPSRLQKSRVTDVDRAIGRRIRDRRIALGLTQQQVGDLIGVTYQQAHKYERGIDRISVGRLLTICAALGWTAAECLASIEQPARVSLGVHQRIELAAAFAKLDRRHAQAVLQLVRALAPEPERGR